MRKKWEKKMFETIHQTNFTEKVINSRKPVLISYLLKDHDYAEHLTRLSVLARIFKGKVKIYLLAENSQAVCRELCIHGDPSFVGFKDGRVKGRILGKVLVEELTAFCDCLLAKNK